MKTRGSSSLIAVVALLATVTAVEARDLQTRSAPVSAAALRQDMRKLWTDHVIWTRDYVVAAVDDRPDAKAAASRLMKNQEDIGKAVAGFYGTAAGDALTTLLKEHITIAVDIITFAKAGDKASQQQADARWHRNAEAIADFLAKANPHWPRATLVSMMNVHLSTTTEEVVARLTKNWDADVRAFDRVYDHIRSLGLYPVVEISFMPHDLASDPSKTVFDYRAIVSPPKDWERWYDLVRDLTQHLVDRYTQAASVD